ncbi:MAG: CvpA family protein, partial [Bermanella sp.]
TGLAGTDRMFGIVFGVARGLVMITAAVYGLQMTAFSQDPWWLQSSFIPHFELMVTWSKNTLPSATIDLLNLGQTR